MKYRFLKMALFNELIFLLYIIIVSNHSITKGFHKILNEISYSIIFDANDNYCNIITSKHFYIINKENNTIKYHEEADIEISSDFLLFKNIYNNYSFIMKNNPNILYTISLKENNEITEISFFDNFIDNFYISGYMSEKLSSSISSDNFYYNDCINKVILYGKNGQNLYFFSYIENQLYDINYDMKGNNNIGEYLSCKIFGNDKYICAFNTGINFGLYAFSCITNTGNCEEKKNLIDTQSGYYDAILYDTDTQEVKILCSKL